MSTNPVHEIMTLACHLDGFAEQLAASTSGFAPTLRAMEPSARRFASAAMMPVIGELLASCERLAAPLRDLHRELEQLAEQE